MANGFNFGGKHSDTWSITVVKKNVPLMPPMKDQYQEIAGRDGVWDFGTQFDARTIELDCVILADSKADYQIKLRNLVGALNPRGGAKELIFDDEPDKMYYARLTGQLPVDQIGTFGKFTLQLICTDPFGYSTTERTSSGASSVNVVHNGTHVARPILTITASSKGAIRNKHPEGSIEELTIDAPGTLVIDCKEFTAKQGGNAAYTYVFGDFLTLEPGTNVITSTGGILNIEVQFRDTWL